MRGQYDILTTIVDTAPSLLVSIDVNGRILNLNPATLHASGYDDEDTVRGKYFWDVFIDAGEREAMRARFHEAAPEFPRCRVREHFLPTRAANRS